MIPRQKLSAYKKIDFSANGPGTPQSEFSSKIELLDDSPPEPEIIEPFNDESPIQAFTSIHHHQKKTQEQDYQEILIVRQSLDFDERQFRDSYIKTESEIILKMRKDVDSLYDWLDKMVAELTKTLNQCQEAKRSSVEDKLKTIREHSVRADAINRSIQNFLSSIQNAYQHTFAAFLDSNAQQKGSSSGVIQRMLGIVINFVKGFVFFLQLFAFGAFTAYAYNQFLAFKHRSLFQELLEVVLPLLIKYGMLEITKEPSITEAKSKFKEYAKIQAPFETSEWLNDLLNELFCKNSFVEHEALLQVLTKVSRKAIQSKLQDYQKESWLFLSSLNLDSFSFGSKLPQIKCVRALQQGTGKLALVLDFEYEGGIEVGLKAAMTLNIRDFQAKLQFRESKFKLVIKLDSIPTPRMSFMISEMPAYDVAVLMRDQPLVRAGNLIKTMLENFIKNRLSFPNYLTLLIRPSSKYSVQIASEKQFQSQLRLRVTTVQLNLLNPNLVGLQEDPSIMCALSLGSFTSKTGAIPASSSRWNSIHSFNIFNGLDESPQSIQITLYQAIDSDAINVIGKAEVPYTSIKAGILDIRQIPLFDDQETIISLELFLHHMQEDGASDAGWIFWNTSRPRVQVTSQSLEQMNWNTVKYIVSRLSSDNQTESLVDLVHSLDESDTISHDSKYQVTEPLLRTLSSHIEWSLSQLKERILRKRNDFDCEDFDDSHDPLHRSLSRAVAILQALKLELSDFSSRFDLTREPLSEVALHEHNKRLANLLLPLIKSFFSGLTIELKFLKVNAQCVESLYYTRPDRVTLVEERIQGVWSLIVQLSKGESFVTEDLPTTDSTPELTTMEAKREFKCYWGDQPVLFSFASQDFINIKYDESLPSSNEPCFDFEGVFYTKTSSTVIDLSSHDSFDSMTAWEVVLIGKALMLIPFGKDHNFPEQIIPLAQVESLELVRDRGAFHLGFNADLSTEQSFQHANCAVLRLKGSDSILAELVGDARTCDQFYCLLSCRLDRSALMKFPLSRLLKTWLLPLSVPAYTTMYALALNLDNSTFVLGNFEDEAIHEAFCQLKQLSKPSTLLTIESDLQSSSLSSMASSLASVSSISSSMSSVFDSRTKYNRISFHNLRTAPITTSHDRPEWIDAAFENISVPLQCTFNGTFEGQIIIAKDYLAFWSSAIVIPLASIKSVKKSGELGVELLLNSKVRHLIAFKTVHDCEQFLEIILL